jgi:hypothetical protein
METAKKGAAVPATDIEQKREPAPIQVGDTTRRFLRGAHNSPQESSLSELAICIT